MLDIYLVTIAIKEDNLEINFSVTKEKLITDYKFIINISFFIRLRYFNK